jgi:hypothetical protein
VVPSAGRPHPYPVSWTTAIAFFDKGGQTHVRLSLVSRLRFICIIHTADKPVRQKRDCARGPRSFQISCPLFERPAPFDGCLKGLGAPVYSIRIAHADVFWQADPAPLGPAALNASWRVLVSLDGLVVLSRTIAKGRRMRDLVCRSILYDRLRTDRCYANNALRSRAPFPTALMPSTVKQRGFGPGKFRRNPASSF